MSSKSLTPKNLLTASLAPTGPNLIAGDIYYDTVVKAIRCYDGSAWVDLINDETTQYIYGTKRFVAGGTAAIPLEVQGFSGQTANLQTWYNSTPTALASVNKDGVFVAVAPTTSIPSIRMPHGTAPSAPTNGDFWTTTAGLYGRINGATVGPFGAAGAVYDSETFSYSGTLVTATGAHRLYNDDGATRTIQSVRASVGTQPTGASILVDVNLGGTTIFSTQGNRPTIAVSTNTDESGTPDTTAWTDGGYLTVDIDQIGSTIAGADLTVTVVYTK